MLRWKHGMASLWALLLLSSVLWLFLLLDNDLLALQRANIGERMRYLQQRESLLARSLSLEADQACRQAAEQQETGETFRLTFAVSDDRPDQQHFLLCQKQSLFKQLPQQAQQTGINMFLYPELGAWPFFTLPLTTTEYQHGGILWMAENSQWHLETDFFGIVIAEGDLTLSGSGTVFGALIHNGKVRLERQEQIIFTPHVIEKIAAEYQQWQYQQGGWHDFNPL